MDLDDLDIYNDLDGFQEEENKKSKELVAWEAKYNDAQKTVEALRQENKALNKKIKRMEVNFQSLLDTAKAEIKRKDLLIAQIRREKDDICFRRRPPPVRPNIKQNENNQIPYQPEAPAIEQQQFVANPFKSQAPIAATTEPSLALSTPLASAGTCEEQPVPITLLERSQSHHRAHEGHEKRPRRQFSYDEDYRRHARTAHSVAPAIIEKPSLSSASRESSLMVQGSHVSREKRLRYEKDYRKHSGRERSRSRREDDTRRESERRDSRESHKSRDLQSENERKQSRNTKSKSHHIVKEKPPSRPHERTERHSKEKDRRYEKPDKHHSRDKDQGKKKSNKCNRKSKSREGSPNKKQVETEKSLKGVIAVTNIDQAPPLEEATSKTDENANVQRSILSTPKRAALFDELFPQHESNSGDNNRTLLSNVLRILGNDSEIATESGIELSGSSDMERQSVDKSPPTKRARSHSVEENQSIALTAIAQNSIEQFATVEPPVGGTYVSRSEVSEIADAVAEFAIAESRGLCLEPAGVNAMSKEPLQILEDLRLPIVFELSPQVIAMELMNCSGYASEVLVPSTAALEESLNSVIKTIDIAGDSGETTGATGGSVAAMELTDANSEWQTQVIDAAAEADVPFEKGQEVDESIMERRDRVLQQEEPKNNIEIVEADNQVQDLKTSCGTPEPAHGTAELMVMDEPNESISTKEEATDCKSAHNSPAMNENSMQKRDDEAINGICFAHTETAVDVAQVQLNQINLSRLANTMKKRESATKHTVAKPKIHLKLGVLSKAASKRKMKAKSKKSARHDIHSEQNVTQDADTPLKIVAPPAVDLEAESPIRARAQGKRRIVESSSDEETPVVQLPQIVAVNSASKMWQESPVHISDATSNDPASQLPVANMSQDEKFMELDTRLHCMFQSPPYNSQTSASPCRDPAPPPSDPPVNSTAQTHKDELVAEATIDATTVASASDHNVSDNSCCDSLNASIETKRLSLGSSDYRFEKGSDNVIKLFITRKRGKTKTAKKQATVPTIAATIPLMAPSNEPST